MKETSITLPIFPLPVFLLPDGITRLRIFEPRYLKMVTIAMKGHGFVIWLTHQKQEKQTPEWGSWVEVINFDQGKDGVLEIDVKCKALVNINSIEKNVDNLHLGKVCEIFHWSQCIDEKPTTDLQKSLKEVLVNDAMLSELYAHNQSKNTNWVVARWLEILPVNLAIKSDFVDTHNYDQAKHFVQSIISQDKKSKLI